MPRPPKTWKKVELAVARLLGGRRCHFQGSDVEAGGWAVEVKHGRQIPRTLLKWWGQAEQKRWTARGRCWYCILPVLLTPTRWQFYAWLTSPSPTLLERARKRRPMVYGPLPIDETSDRYAECPWCGSRLTHLHGQGC